MSTEKENYTLIDNDKDKEQLVEMLNIRNNFMNYIGIQNFIDHVRTVIKESEHFEFRSLNSEKFINAEKPVFIIKVKDGHLKDIHIPSKKNDIAEDELYRSSIVRYISSEIFTPAGDIINNYIKGNDELEKKLVGIDSSITEMVLSNIYSVLVGNHSDNIIHIQLIV